MIVEYGYYFGYYINRSKSWLIVKPEKEEAHIIFADTTIKISEGRKHLVAVIGTNKFNELIKEWIGEIRKLAEIAKTIQHIYIWVKGAKSVPSRP